uniref:Uncharacterized protein n=1 Tax=Rhabditophanes sp. KR3021 TaxID=114890 RepID=A0AC35UFB5_9BILA
MEILTRETIKNMLSGRERKESFSDDSAPVSRKTSADIRIGPINDYSNHCESGSFKATPGSVIAVALSAVGVKLSSVFSNECSQRFGDNGRSMSLDDGDVFDHTKTIFSHNNTNKLNRCKDSLMKAKEDRFEKAHVFVEGYSL